MSHEPDNQTSTISTCPIYSTGNLLQSFQGQDFGLGIRIDLANPDDVSVNKSDPGADAPVALFLGDEYQEFFYADYCDNGMNFGPMDARGLGCDVFMDWDWASFVDMDNAMPLNVEGGMELWDCW